MCHERAPVVSLPFFFWMGGCHTQFFTLLRKGTEVTGRWQEEHAKPCLRKQKLNNQTWAGVGMRSRRSLFSLGQTSVLLLIFLKSKLQILLSFPATCSLLCVCLPGCWMSGLRWWLYRSLACFPVGRITAYMHRINDQTICGHFFLD